MNESQKTVQIQREARLAGFFYFLVIPLGVFGMMYVPSNILLPGYANATVQNVLQKEFLFRLSMLSSVLAQLVNLVAVFFLYRLLRPVNKTGAFLMVFFLSLGVPVALLNELNRGAVLYVAHNPAIPADRVLLFFHLHELGIKTAGIFWGLWLLPMGWLVFRSTFLPRWIGVFLIIACFGYLGDSILFYLLPDSGIRPAEFTFIGELMIIFWLLIRGVNPEKYRRVVSRES